LIQLNQSNNGEDCWTGGELTAELALLLRDLICGKEAAVHPGDFNETFFRRLGRFRQGRQEDAEAALLSLLDAIHQDTKDGNNESIVSSTFDGVLTSQLSCPVGHVSAPRCDPFRNLNLQIDSSKDNCTMEDCLTKTFDGEEEVSWKCPSCDQNVSATRKLSIMAAPSFLFTSFKRFSHKKLKGSSNTTREHKIVEEVELDLDNLDLSQHVFENNSTENSSVYEAFAVISHTGTLRMGHYFAHVRDNDDKWRCFNDDDVEVVDSVDTKNAYIVLWRKKGLPNEALLEPTSQSRLEQIVDSVSTRPENAAGEETDTDEESFVASDEGCSDSDCESTGGCCHLDDDKGFFLPPGVSARDDSDLPPAGSKSKSCGNKTKKAGKRKKKAKTTAVTAVLDRIDVKWNSFLRSVQKIPSVNGQYVHWVRPSRPSADSHSQEFLNVIMLHYSPTALQFAIDGAVLWQGGV
jgi:hypothetical protein